MYRVKKIIVTILAVAYLASTVGATVHMHYCMDELVSMSFSHSDEKICDKCGMDKTKDGEAKDCCKDEHKQLKLENGHKAAPAFLLQEQFAIDLPVSFLHFSITPLPSITEQNPVSNAPPRSCCTALHIRNCVFRI